MSTDTRLAVLESDMKKMDGFYDRLDSSIEKIAELNVSIREVLSSHETRLNATEVELETQFSMFDQRYEQLHSEVEMRVCEYLGIEPVFNLGDTVKSIDDNVLVSAQRSIINHANKELDNLENYISGDEK